MANRPIWMSDPYDVEKAVSGTDQTGLIPVVPEDEDEAEAYEALYPIHRQKPLH